jgi:hypothetical protein
MKRERSNKGMALAIILIALFVFSIVMFAIAQQQQHETRFTAMSIEQEKAFVLADAGLARALARHVARPYANRWYGNPPTDDREPNEHAGFFDDGSQTTDGGGDKLEAGGGYTVLVEDRFTGETAGDQPSQDSKLDFTDVFARGTYDGPHGVVSALLFARLAIAPEVPFFPPTAGVTPTVSSDESTPELVKRCIRYKVYFDPETADQTYEHTGADTAKLRGRVHEEIAQYHANFLKNRNTFKDLRDTAKVNKDWQAGTAGQAKWTHAQILALFDGIAGPAPLPAGDSSPDGASGEFFNLWTEFMVRVYRVSDLVPANTGAKYLIGSHPTDTETRVAGNILRVFFGQTVTPIPAELKEGAANPVTTGDRLLQTIGTPPTTEKRSTYDTNVSSWHRTEAHAKILQGHLNPFPWPPAGTAPPPSPQPSPPQPVADHYVDDAFKKRFFTEDVQPSIKDEMKAECTRVNGLGGNVRFEDKVQAPDQPTQKPFPIYLRYDTPPLASTPTTTGPVQLSVPELVKLYAKYIESAAIFDSGDPPHVTPTPPMPTTPPPTRPPPSGNGNGNGNNGHGGGSPDGIWIGGSASGL